MVPPSGTLGRVPEITWGPGWAPSDNDEAKKRLESRSKMDMTPLSVPRKSCDIYFFSKRPKPKECIFRNIIFDSGEQAILNIRTIAELPTKAYPILVRPMEPENT